MPRPLDLRSRSPAAQQTLLTGSHRAEDRSQDEWAGWTLTPQVVLVPSRYGVPRMAASCWSGSIAWQAHAALLLSASQATHRRGSRPSVHSWCSTHRWHWRSTLCCISLRDKPQPSTLVSAMPAPLDQRTAVANAEASSPVLQSLLACSGSLARLQAGHALDASHFWGSTCSRLTDLQQEGDQKNQGNA